jgi:hypothetical protein
MNNPAVGALTCTDPVDEGVLPDPEFEDVEFPPVPDDEDVFCEVKLELPHPIVHITNANTASRFTANLPLARRRDTDTGDRPNAIQFRRNSQTHESNRRELPHRPLPQEKMFKLPVVR